MRSSYVCLNSRVSLVLCGSLQQPTDQSDNLRILAFDDKIDHNNTDRFLPRAAVTSKRPIYAAVFFLSVRL